MSNLKLPSERRSKRRKRTVPASLRRMYDRALVADQADVEAYSPAPLDFEICDCYLQGAVTHKEIAEATGTAPATISAHLRDPIVAAWIAKNLHSVVKQRIGLLDAAMFSRALAGSVGAAKLVLERYGQLVDRKIVIHTTPEGIPFEELPTEDLRKIVASRGKIIDVKAETDVQES